MIYCRHQVFRRVDLKRALCRGSESRSSAERSRTFRRSNRSDAATLRSPLKSPMQVFGPAVRAGWGGLTVKPSTQKQNIHIGWPAAAAAAGDWCSHTTLAEVMCAHIMLAAHSTTRYIFVVVALETTKHKTGRTKT